MGVQSPTEINAPRGCAVILRRICQLTLTRITHQVSRAFDLNGGEVDLCINIYRGQVDTNSAMINANGIKNGTNDVDCGAKVPLDKEQTQLEKLLQIIEKNPSATQAYYAEEMGISKRTVSRMFVSLQEKGRLVQNGTKRKSNWKIIR